LDEDEMTEPLFLAANKYQIDGLKDLCEQSPISKLNLETVAHYLVLAHQHDAPQLLESSLNLLKEHKKEISDRAEWKELKNIYPDLFFLVKYRMVGPLGE
jgi:speckle-type POZ protein